MHISRGKETEDFYKYLNRYNEVLNEVNNVLFFYYLVFYYFSEQELTK